MTEREMILSLLDNVPKYKMGYVIAYLQGLTADEFADDEFCKELYENYLKSEDKHEFVPIDELYNDSI